MVDTTNVYITLHHYHYGPMLVTVWPSGSEWMGCRIWVCDEHPKFGEFGSFEDKDFDEHYMPPGQRIDDILAAASMQDQELSS